MSDRCQIGANMGVMTTRPGDHDVFTDVHSNIHLAIHGGVEGRSPRRKFWLHSVETPTESLNNGIRANGGAAMMSLK